MSIFMTVNTVKLAWGLVDVRGLKITYVAAVALVGLRGWGEGGGVVTRKVYSFRTENCGIYYDKKKKKIVSF